MIVGVPKEIKTAEHRVALVPAGGESLGGGGHSGVVGQGAGGGPGVVGGGGSGGGGGAPAPGARGGGPGPEGGPGRGEPVVWGGGVGVAGGEGGGAGGPARAPRLAFALAPPPPPADVLPSIVALLYPTRHNLLEQLSRADLMIGAVLLPGAKAP